MPYANNLFLAERISLEDEQCYEKIPEQISFKILSFEDQKEHQCATSTKVDSYKHQSMALGMEGPHTHLAKARHILRAAKLQKPNTEVDKTPTSSIEFSSNNPYINKDTSKDQNNITPSMDIYILANNMELSLQNIENELVTEMPNKPTQAETVQVTEKNKKGAHPRINNKKRKAEELEEREANRKMLKVKEETSQNTLVKINNSYENNTLQQMEQTNMDVQTTLVVDNEDPNKQSWAEMMDNDSDNLKDVNNETNPWVIPSTNET
ncbi:39777_t:CDS:2, partial [Gigaspora margarita]